MIPDSISFPILLRSRPSRYEAHTFDCRDLGVDEDYLRDCTEKCKSCSENICSPK